MIAIHSWFITMLRLTILSNKQLRHVDGRPGSLGVIREPHNE